MTEQQTTERNLTPRELCALEGISLTTLYEIERAGYGPDWVRYPGVSVTVKRLTPEARRAWHERLKDWRIMNAKQIEKQRAALVERASVLGRLSAASPRHPSRRRTMKVRR